MANPLYPETLTPSPAPATPKMPPTTSPDQFKRNVDEVNRQLRKEIERNPNNRQTGQ